MPGPVAEPSLSPGRRRLFVGITLALPWALLLLAELLLRAGGYGGSYPLFVPAAGRPDWLVANPDVGRRYFGAGPFAPTPEVDYFRARKSPSTWRVVFQGESSAQGFPYGHGAMPSRMLERRLQATLPDRDVEVVNVALTAVNSYTLLDQADEIIAVHPDAVLIYTGHNEYYGAFGAGASGGIGGSRAVVRAYLALRRLRLVQLLASVLGAGAPRRTDAEAPRTVMQLMAGEQRIPLGSPRYERGLAQFRANLAELLARYRAAGIPVIIGTVASNERDQPPFVSGFTAGADTIAWRREYDAGADALRRGDPASALARIQACVRLDSMAAGGWFLLGRWHDEAGDEARAHDAYARARDRDELRFRAPEAINAIIREEGARHGATVVETRDALARASGGDVVDRDVMLEHLHPNLRGYAVIADAFHDAMAKRSIIGGPGGAVAASAERVEAAVTPLDSLVGAYRTDRLTSYWPFAARGAERTPVVDTLQPRTTVEQLAKAVVLGQLPWAEATERLRAAADAAGDGAMARRAATALAQEYAWSPAPLLDLARLAMREGRDDEALAHARAANAREETADGARIAGLLLLRRGEQGAGVAQLRRAAELAPADRRVVGTYRAAAALPDLAATAARAPRDTTALFNLALAYALTQQDARAREVVRALRAVAPGHAGARELLAQLPAVAPGPGRE